MVDSLGFRLKLGIIAPSTNTSVQPEMDAMRPYGVTNHFGRLYIPDDPIKNDDDFNKLMDDIRAALMDAVAEVYASIFGPDPTEYRAERGLLDVHEEMDFA